MPMRASSVQQQVAWPMIEMVECWEMSMSINGHEIVTGLRVPAEMPPMDALAALKFQMVDRIARHIEPHWSTTCVSNTTIMEATVKLNGLTLGLSVADPRHFTESRDREYCRRKIAEGIVERVEPATRTLKITWWGLPSTVGPDLDVSFGSNLTVTAGSPAILDSHQQP